LNFQADIIVHIKEPPGIEIADGTAFVTDKSGRTVLQRAMSPNTLRVYAERAIRLLNEWETAQHGKVVRLDGDGGG
jgi:hypothetical protein